MDQLFARQLEKIVGSCRPAECVELNCEAQLRIAAATLCDAPPGLVTATTAVGVLGLDDAAAVEALVADIADELQLKTEFRIHLGSFSVRFSRH